MKSLCALTLLIVLPFAGVRMVCLDADGLLPAARVAPRVGAAGAVDDGASCAQQCARHAKAAQRIKCLLVDDGDRCAFLIDASTAVLPQAAPMPAPLTVTAIAGLSDAMAYADPLRPPPGPPPKA